MCPSRDPGWCSGVLRRGPCRRGILRIIVVVRHDQLNHQQFGIHRSIGSNGKGMRHVRNGRIETSIRTRMAAGLIFTIVVTVAVVVVVVWMIQGNVHFPLHDKKQFRHGRVNMSRNGLSRMNGRHGNPPDHVGVGEE